MNRWCSVDGCEGAHVARGLCGKHYQAAAKAGRLPPRLNGFRGEGWNRRGKTRMIRSLDEVPDRPPDSRYVLARGYVVLQWRVGVDRYLACYEHRLVAGFPVGLDVHHRNETKDDNGPGNLEPLSKAEHARQHSRTLDDGLVAQLYLSGMSTVEVGAAVGAHNVSVLRSLIRSGTPRRSFAEAIRLRERRRAQRRTNRWGQPPGGRR